MNWIVAKTPSLLAVAVLAASIGAALAAEPVFPVKVSDNGRYFVDQQGRPVFWLGTTQWQLFREYKLEEARTIIEKTKEKGFVFAQVMLMGVGDGTQPNVYGAKPWTGDNPLTPNEAYFKHVDAVLQIARDNNVVISMTLYHQRYRKHITVENARAWAKWLALRYKDAPNIVWSMTPEAKQEFVPVLRELAAGLHEGDGGRHLITCKPDPAPYSSSFIHGEKWLAFDSMQVWKGVELIYPMVTKDYHRQPTKPVLMAEGAYEAGTEYGFDVTPLWIRRQAYYSYLAGAHHTYGHNDSWRVLPTWKQALDAPGAVQLGLLKKVFLERSEWWNLVPDQAVFASGGNTGGKVLNLAARHQDGRWAVVYLGGKAAFSIDMGKLAAGKEARATWFDPASGKTASIGRYAASGTQAFSTPEGWEDALLILEVETTVPARASETKNADLMRFLPNHGNCVFDAKSLLRQWPPGGPKELWRVEVGWGKSAVVEADGRAFTAAESDDQQWALCLDPATGATRWKHLLYPRKNRHFEWGPVTSPVIDGDRVYFIPYANHDNDVWEMRCPIICLKTDGSELWRVDKEVWATEGSTPLVVGDTLYVGADNPQHAVLVALDKMTGAVRWTAAAKSEKPRELAAPASLCYQVVDGVPQVIVATYGTREVLGVHATSGEIMWRYPYPADIILGLISTPVAIGPRLFLSAGEGKGRNFSACLEMQAAGGKIGCRELYRSTELQTNLFHTASIYRDAVFGFGGGNKAGFLHCTSFSDGRLLWKEESRDWTKDQNLAIADGLLFALTRNDELVMAEASPQRYRELGRVDLKTKLGRPQHPTIANGRLYIRGEQWVVCYQVGQ